MNTGSNSSQKMHISSHCKFYRKNLPIGYTVDKPLGRGRFATVWNAKKGTIYGGRVDDDVAVKVFRCSTDNYKNIRYYTNEVKILQKLAKAGTSPFITRYVGTFAHVEMVDDIPSIHPCIIFELMESSLSKLIRYCISEYSSGLPLRIAKKLTFQLMQAIAHVHNAGIVHTDIKPSNILLDGPIDEYLADKISIKLADFGSSTIDGEMFTSSPGTTGYIAPELIIDTTYGKPIDIWAAFTVCFEMITGNLLFDVYNECKMQYGSDVDGEALDGLMPEKSDETMRDVEEECDSCEADSFESGSSGDEGEIEEERIHYRYLLLIAKVLGYPPKEFTTMARKYYNRKDRLMYNPDISPISISDLLMINCSNMTIECASDIEEFLLTGLKYNPDERITAEKALNHKFLIQSAPETN